MMTMKKNKFFFNLFGIVVVAFWLVMIGLLVKKIHFKDHPVSMDYGGPLDIADTIDSPQREWKEIYLNDKKVGYAVNMIKPFRGGYFIQEEVFLKLNLMGMASGIHTITQSRTDNRFLLKSFNFGMTSGVVRFDITGRVQGGELLIETGKGKDRRTRKIKLSSTPMIGSGMGYFFKSKKISVGETFRLPIFDPSTMAQKEAVIRVVDRESININKRRHNAFRLETEMWGRLMKFWLDEEGTTLKEEGFMGLTVVKSSAANAPRDLEVAGEEDVDFYEMVAIKLDKKLPDPTRLSYLKLKVDGIDNASISPDVLNSERQKFHGGTIEIEKENLPFKASYLLPYEDKSDEMKPFLEPEFNIESDEKEIVKMAQEISGKDKSPLSVARKLLNWVYHELDKKPVVVVPSALEVLRTRVGDCNEHATLLTALLRAKGIPSRLSVGLVYTRGKFFYHAWTEAYLGEWVSMDATLNQMPVDATHIKLVQGNLDKQLEIAGLIGTLTLKVLDYRL